MSNTQILNIGIPIAIGFAIILAIGYGKTLHNDINTKPKPKLTARVDLSDVRNNLKEIEEDLSIMTVQVEEGVKKIDKIEKIEKSLQSIRNLSAKQQERENSIQTRKLIYKPPISALEKNRNRAALLFSQFNKGKINHDDLKSIRSLNPESLKELIEELETDNLAGAKKKLKHKKSKKRK